MRWAAGVSALALLASPAFGQLPGGQLPGVGDAARRVTVDARMAPWSSLVRVQVPGLARCTGVLVAPDLVATAAHCLFSARLGRFIPAGSVNVLLGYSGGGYAGHAVARGYRIAERFDPHDVEATRGADVALIRLAGPLTGPVLGLAERVLGLAEQAGDGAVVLGGYQQDRAEVIAADLDCRLVGRAVDQAGRGLLVHGCAATRGSSGAPLLMRASDGTWQVLGIQSGGRQGARGGVAVPAAAVRVLLATPP